MELEHQYLVTPGGTINWNVDEKLFNGGIKPVSPELRFLLASLKWCSQTVWSLPDSMWNILIVYDMEHMSPP